MKTEARKLYSGVFEYFCQLSWKSILTVLSYTVSNLVHFSETQCSFGILSVMTRWLMRLTYKLCNCRDSFEVWRIPVINRCSERQRWVYRKREIPSSFFAPSMRTRRLRSGVRASSRKSSASSFRCRRALPLALLHFLHFRSRDTTSSPTSGVADAGWRMRWTYQTSTSLVPPWYSSAATPTSRATEGTTQPSPNDSRRSPVGPARRPAVAGTDYDFPSTWGRSSGTDSPSAAVSRQLWTPWVGTCPVQVSWPIEPRTTC